ncbi:MAG: ATP-binding protein, partial [Butyricicoccus sp.]|nr:ATP-binding protein [Butyricicoccus sp.]
MQADEIRPVDLTADAGYDSQWTLMRDLFVWLDLRLYYFYSHHQWLGPSSEMKNMLGLVVTREEFEHQLAKSAQMGLEEELSEEERTQLEEPQRAIALRLRRTAQADIPLLRLFERCGLDAFEQNCVILAYAAVLDRKYEKLLAYLQDDMTRKAPGTALAVQLFLPRGGNMEQYLARFTQRGRFARLFRRDALERGELILHPLALEYLSSGTIENRPGLTVFDGTTRRPDGPLIVQGEVARQLDRMMEQALRCVVCLSGGAGSGKRFQVEHLLSRWKARGVFADLESEDWREQAEQAALAACLLDAYLCLYHLDRTNENGDLVPAPQHMMDVLCDLETGKDRLFLLSRLPMRARIPRLTVDLALPTLTESERLELFRTFLRDQSLADDVTAEELAAKFHFSPQQIRLACQQAAGMAGLNSQNKLDGAQLHAACYRQVVHKLGDLAHRVPAAYTWDDVVMPAAQKRLMQQACGHIRYQYRVYHQWGFEKRVTYGRGLSILFAGAPGTGKTMCAQVIARQLNMEMYKINISQIVSKYIGETEKNLQAVFAEAKNSNCILFFDECDALFGKRSEVKDSHDRNANVEVAYLLQQIEEYDGVCILATNLIGNIDEAFMRRITYVVHFPFPDRRMREQIYRQMMPAAVPLSEDIDWEFLAEKFELSGGHIKNIVLAAAFMAAGEDSPVSMRHL